eukprot:5557436-Amphidinium_carterae.1
MNRNQSPLCFPEDEGTKEPNKSTGRLNKLRSVTVMPQENSLTKYGVAAMGGKIMRRACKPAGGGLGSHHLAWGQSGEML